MLNGQGTWEPMERTDPNASSHRAGKPTLHGTTERAAVAGTALEADRARPSHGRTETPASLICPAGKWGVNTYL